MSNKKQEQTKDSSLNVYSIILFIIGLVLIGFQVYNVSYTKDSVINELKIANAKLVLQREAAEKETDFFKRENDFYEDKISQRLDAIDNKLGIGIISNEHIH